MYSKLQYISQGETIQSQKLNIIRALEGGCKWIQLRFKNGTQQKLETLALEIKELCKLHQATFIINDFVMLCKQVDADGVHLGLSDTSIVEAREILGSKKIIGGTANTLQDVLQRINESANYIGLGPFAFTETKQKLSPILGLEGYYKIITSLTNAQKYVPIFAIGGITIKDINPLMQTKIYGIALSGFITKSNNTTQTINQINTILYETT